MHDWQYFFNCERTFLNQDNYRIFEPSWKTKILQWFRREDVAKAQKEAFIQALIDFDDNCSDFYRYRAYFIAAEALAYFPECSLGDVIVAQLLKWSYGYFRQDKRDWQIVPKPLVKAARTTLELTGRKRVIAAFVDLVHTTESRTILRRAAEKLAQFDPGNKSALAALALLHSLPNQEKIAVSGESAIAAVIQIMETTPNKYNCWEAIATLGKIAVGNQTAIASLVKFLQINQGDRICLDAAKVLWQLDPGNAAVIQALIYLLENSASAFLRECAAVYLLEIEPANQVGIDALCDSIKNIAKFSEHVDYARYIACVSTERLLEVHTSLHEGNQAVIAALIELIYTTKNDYLLCDVARTLGKINPGNEIAIPTLLQIIETTEDESICCQYAAYLGELIPGNIFAINKLSQLISSTQSEWVRISANQNLLKIDLTNPTAIATLSQIRKSNLCQYESILFATVLNLEQLHLANQILPEKLNEVISTLIQFIQPLTPDDDNQNCFNSQTTNQQSYEDYLMDIADVLTKILRTEDLPQVITALKGYLSQPFAKNSSYRYDAVFHIIWHCANNLNYPDFYTAWHN
ncbi:MULTISPECIES: HEAT repeat domain-containing protein [Calothrix]|uniref:HEAT repeat domain-containing protein n=2 Tax=Calothrix TaxID=1186 RepID=A0ABR8A6M5_9CYAN|nr:MULTISPECIES: HEAT repeat domain-containing protein [Calothrix]MBD2195060.1 HEAT repeat domain-containing protein [Calothrix parietina FACHB-288]MBD2223658.1 HEAT repeat domain-containing protein [Calothrix anomala FACHB-343]